MTTQTTAIDAYLARAADIHIKFARLQQLAGDHFGNDPDAVHWGHVGDLGRVNQALDDLLAIFDGQPLKLLVAGPTYKAVEEIRRAVSVPRTPTASRGTGHLPALV